MKKEKDNILDMVKEQKSKLSGLLGESQEQPERELALIIDDVKTIINGSGTIESKIQSLYKQLGEVSRQFQNLFLDRVLAIGSLLSEQKKALGHGHFENWVNNNLPFTDRQARKYLRVFESSQNGSLTSVLESIDKNNIDTVYNAIQKNLKQGKEKSHTEKQDQFTKWTEILESGDQYKIEKAFKQILNEKEKVEEKLNEIKELKEKLSKIKEIHSLYWKAKKGKKKIFSLTK